MSKLIIGEQEKLIHDRKRDLVIPGTLTGQLNKKAEIEALERKQKQLFKEASEAPTPRIGLLSTDVLLTAVPLLQKTTSSGIVTLDYDNMNDDIFNGKGEMNFTINPVQTVLVIGDQVKEVYPSLKVGMKVRFEERNFIAARTKGNNPEHELYYDLPTVRIDGHEYLQMNASSIKYYLKE